jgi:hypothetical protein
MNELEKTKQFLLAIVAAMEAVVIENEALWAFARACWPDYRQARGTPYQMFEEEVEKTKADPQVTGRVRESFAQYRAEIEACMDLAEAQGLLTKFPSRGFQN